MRQFRCRIRLKSHFRTTVASHGSGSCVGQHVLSGLTRLDLDECVSLDTSDQKLIVHAKKNGLPLSHSSVRVTKAIGPYRAVRHGPLPFYCYEVCDLRAVLGSP